MGTSRARYEINQPTYRGMLVKWSPCAGLVEPARLEWHGKLRWTPFVRQPEPVLKV
jgi:hypothetical protein